VPVLEGLNDGERLLVMHFVVEFRVGELAKKEGNQMELTVKLLRDDGAKCQVGGVRFNDALYP
jgi:hypothetical protein